MEPNSEISGTAGKKKKKGKADELSLVQQSIMPKYSIL